jgi:hypothetical protein
MSELRRFTVAALQEGRIPLVLRTVEITAATAQQAFDQARLDGFFASKVLTILDSEAVVEDA